jgi:hypothetical protein
VREDAEAELVESAVACPLDRRPEERRADAAPPPLACDRHVDLAESVPTPVDVYRPDDLGTGDRDQYHPLERPARGARLDVYGRLRGDSVALLGDRGEHDRKRKAVSVARGADLERRFRQGQILAR